MQQYICNKSTDTESSVIYVSEITLIDHADDVSNTPKMNSCNDDNNPDIKHSVYGVAAIIEDFILISMKWL